MFQGTLGGIGYKTEKIGCGLPVSHVEYRIYMVGQVAEPLQRERER